MSNTCACPSCAAARGFTSRLRSAGFKPIDRVERSISAHLRAGGSKKAQIIADLETLIARGKATNANAVAAPLSLEAALRDPQSDLLTAALSGSEAPRDLITQPFNAERVAAPVDLLSELQKR